jgi:hypothetical protein
MRTTDPFEVLAEPDLLGVVGAGDPGYDPASNGLGRVGLGTSWKWLGNYYTPEALAHDKAVRSGIAHGESPLTAHIGALPKVPAAIGSYFRARFHPGPDDKQLPTP